MVFFGRLFSRKPQPIKRWSDLESDATYEALDLLYMTPFAQMREMLHNTPKLMMPEIIGYLILAAQKLRADYPLDAELAEIYAELLEIMQRVGIDPVMDYIAELESQPYQPSAPPTPPTPTASPAPPTSSETPPPQPATAEGEIRELFRQWITQRSPREQRRFLQQYHRLLDQAGDKVFAQLIADISSTIKNDGTDPQRLSSYLQEQRQLLNDIRAHLARLRQESPQAQERVLADRAIREEYLNWHGGFTLDVPDWLAETIAAELKLKGPRYEIAEQRLSLWERAWQRAVTDQLAPEILAEIQSNLGLLLGNRVRGDRPDDIERAIECLSNAARVFTEDAYPIWWAGIQNNLGLRYEIRVLGSRAENIEIAITCFFAALRAWKEETHPQQWAMSQSNLGVLYAERVRGNHAENLELALACYNATLRVRTQKYTPDEWADTQHNLGNLYSNRIVGDHAENLERAIAYATATLLVFTENNFPFQWARSQHTLGNRYLDRIRGDHSENIEKSLAFFHSALRVYTEGTLPMDWATTQHGLGNCYMDRIVGDRAENIEQAIAHLTAALRVRTEADRPRDWAMSQNSLGDCYRDRIVGDRTENLETALSCYVVSLRVRTEADLPMDWAMTQNKLGMLYGDRLVGNRAENMEQAITCLSGALRVYSEEALPHDWAMAQNNLGTLYGERIRGDRAENLERARTCFLGSLRVIKEELSPLEWASTQNNLGMLYERWVKEDQAQNLEMSIAHFSEALRIRTAEADPFGHRSISLHCAEVQARAARWGDANETYQSALRTEDGLYALAGGAKGQDAMLARGREGPARNAYVLAQPGRLGEAAVTLERGQARGLAAARSLDAADPRRIHDPRRRADYIAKRDAWREALARVQQPDGSLGLLDLLSTTPEELARRRAEQDARHREQAQRLRQAQDAFYASVAAIQVAGDPADFLRDNVTEATLMAAAHRGPEGHAIVSLIATPWGGMALGALTANPQAGTRDRFASLAMPAFTNDAILPLFSHELDGLMSKVIGGFAHAQNGTVLLFMLRDWTDREQPTWNGVPPLWEREERDRERYQQAMLKVSYAQIAGWLHRVCTEHGITSSLDRALQETIAEQRSRMDFTMPVAQMTPQQDVPFSSALRHSFLRHEIERGLTMLSDLVMRPLADWLRKESVTSVTIIPCGMLTAFPILACPLTPDETFADAFQASIAPSMRSLLITEQSHHRRHGVATLANPFPTHQPLKYGQAEALTLAHLGGEHKRSRIQGEATQEWLLHSLRNALVVDASCHGIASPDYLESSLQLADGMLSLGDVLNRSVADLHGLRLLILSACQTAIPDLRGVASEVRSLAVGMLQAGAESVIASLWSVDDRATYLLMVRFAQEWFPHMATEPPSAALARAQRWLRQVTWQELSAWQAQQPLPAILTAMPDSRPYNQPEESLAGSGRMATVRGSEGYPRGNADPSDDDDPTRGERYTMVEGQENIRDLAARRAQRQPGGRPYAHPFYWSGFQVTGW